MIPRCILSALVGATVLFPTDAVARTRAGTISFELDHNKHSRLAVAQKVHFRTVFKCKLVAIHGARRRFVVRAIAHASIVLSDPVFRNQLRRRRSWTRARAGSRGILRKLTRSPVTIHVTSFRRNKRHPCLTHLADSHTNAFVPDVRKGRTTPTRLLFLSEQYVHEQYFAPDPVKGVRNLAKTLIHEALHVLGYSHSGEAPFSIGYNNSVPVYVGCMVLNWGIQAHTRWARRNCHLATRRRATRSPYRWLCYTSRSLRRYVGHIVRVSHGPHPITGKPRLRRANLLRVHGDNTLTIRWRNGGQIKRINKCRIVM